MTTQNTTTFEVTEANSATLTELNALTALVPSIPMGTPVFDLDNEFPVYRRGDSQTAGDIIKAFDSKERAVVQEIDRLETVDTEFMNR